MRRRIPLALAGLLALASAGCYRAFISPILPPPYRDQIASPYDPTWQALIRALAYDNVSLRTVAKDSGVISSDDIVSPIGVFADCGREGTIVLEGEALVAFTIFVQPNGGTTDVQVNSRMRTQGHRRGDSGKLRPEPVYQCASTGRWEANLLDSIRRLVKEKEGQ